MSTFNIIFDIFFGYAVYNLVCFVFKVTPIRYNIDLSVKFYKKYFNKDPVIFYIDEIVLLKMGKQNQYVKVVISDIDIVCEQFSVRLLKPKTFNTEVVKSQIVSSSELIKLDEQLDQRNEDAGYRNNAKI